MRRFWRLLAQFVSLLVLVAVPVVHTWAIDCPKNISQMDCAAINGGWTDWVPSSSSCSGSSIALTGADNKAKTWNFLISQGFTPNQAAGILGNLDWESGGALDPRALEANGSGTRGYTGHGVVQWSKDRWRTDYGPYDKNAESGIADAARQSDLTNFEPYPVIPLKLTDSSLLGFAQSQNQDWFDLGIQLSFMMKEIQPGGSRSSVLPAMKATTTLADAATIWFNDYESPGDDTLGKRIERGEEALALYGGGAAPSSSSTSSIISAGGCVGAVNCDTGTATTEGNLSQIRQNVVCLAQQELALWKGPNVATNELCKKYGAGNLSGGWCEEWCADFMSWLYNQTDYPFTGGQSGGWRLAAVDEIHNLGIEDQNFHWHGSDSGYTPRPGDIAVHKNLSTGVSHVNMVISVSGNTLTLIGGDQGSGPYGGPDSGSIVSEVPQSSFTASDTIGYVSPDN
jgi:hypothetical protein